jgi:magnesium transporter
VDIDLEAGGTLDAVSGVLKLDARERRRIESDTASARLVQSAGRLHLTLEVLEPASDGDDDALARRELDLLAAPNLVVTIHRGPVRAIDRFSAGIAGDSSLGVLDAGDLLSGLVDEVIAGYYGLAEHLEREIDELDQLALRGGGGDLLADLVAIRRRIGVIRRVLTPHRGALAALARPEMRAESDIGRPWPGLVDRLEGAIAALDSLRDALLGTYDIHMGRAAQRANDVMKALTLLSALLLPAVVLAGVMGMNFKVPFFDEPGNFYVVLAAMIAFAVLLLAIARWRRWL